MSKTPLLILLALLASSAVAFFVLMDDAPQLLPVDETAEWLAEEKDPAAEIEAPQEPGEDRTSDDGDLPEGLAAIARETVAASGKTVRYLDVQVWQGRKGVPAVDADVFFLASPPEQDRDAFSAHWSEIAEARGQRFKTDRAGRVRLPPVKDTAIVSAAREGSYGYAKLSRKHRRLETIVLTPDETVTVKVVDARDRPIPGAPVGIVQRMVTRENVTRFKALAARVEALNASSARLQQMMAQHPVQREMAAKRLQALQLKQSALREEMAAVKAKARRSSRGSKSGSKSGSRSKKRSKKPGKPQEYLYSTRRDVRARRRTDAEGMAVFRHFQIYRRRAEGWWPKQHVDQFQAVLLMPLQEPKSEPFAGRPVASNTIVLRAPAMGSIALRTVDLDGRPFTHPVHADLRIEGQNSVPWSRLRVRKGQNDNEIVFPFVGLGLQFVANCRLDDWDFRWSIPAFAGPMNPGEEVKVDVVVSPKDGMLFGRLLAADGQPLAGRKTTFLINSGAGRLEGEDVVLDAGGRFHLPYQVRDKHRGPFRLEIRRNKERPVVGLTMALPRIPAGRVTDLGDLQIDELGRITHGVVVDDRGEPIRGARVQLQRQRDVGGDRPKLRFVDEAFVVDRSDKEGQFDLFGALMPGRYRLRVTAKNHFALDSADVRGGEPTEVVMLRNAKVVGTVVTPPWLESRRVRVTLESSLDPKQRREDRIRDYRGKKFVYFDNTRPGIYRLTMRIQDLPDPILQLDGIEVRPGQTGVHPNLANLDLRGRVHQFVIAAVDDRGAPLKPDWPLVARIVRPTGKAGFFGFGWKGPTLQIVSASPELEVIPNSTGFRAQRTTLGPGRSQLTFLRIPPVELQLPGMRALVGGGLVWVKLKPIQTGGLPAKLTTWDGASKRVGGWYTKMQRRVGGRTLGAGDRVRIPLLADGSYSVTAYLLSTGKSRKTRPVAVPCGKIEVRLVPGGAAQRIVVPVNAEAVRRALARLAAAEAKAGG